MDKYNLNQPNLNDGVYHIRVDSNASSAVPIATFLEEEKKEVEDNICYLGSTNEIKTLEGLPNATKYLPTEENSKDPIGQDL